MFPEYMRVAADQLLAAMLGDRSQVAGPTLLQQQREEVDLKEDVPELVEQASVIAALRRLGQLVGLLDRVGDDLSLVLLAVPGTFPAQPPGDRIEPANRFGATLGGAQRG